eukprot:gene2585-5947_t
MCLHFDSRERRLGALVAGDGGTGLRLVAVDVATGTVATRATFASFAPLRPYRALQRWRGPLCSFSDARGALALLLVRPDDDALPA